MERLPLNLANDQYSDHERFEKSNSVSSTSTTSKIGLLSKSSSKV